MKSAFDIAKEFRLKRQGREFRGLCPLCQANKMELSVWEDDGKLRCRCFYGGCDSNELFRVLVGLEPHRPAAIFNVNDVSQNDRTEWAKRIWEETIPANGGLVEKYLNQRSINMSVPADIRLHPCLKHVPSGQHFPAMVAAIRDANGALKAVHRTYLDLSGFKARLDTPKMSLGPIQGCAIRLAEPTDILGLAEGIETALSAMQMSQLPTWSAICAGNLKEILLPGGIKEVVIFADNGAPGIKAATDAAAVFKQDGLTVKIAYPPSPYEDFNDMLMKGGEA